MQLNGESDWLKHVKIVKKSNADSPISFSNFKYDKEYGNKISISLSLSLSFRPI